jgi:hypothetical protein
MGYVRKAVLAAHIMLALSMPLAQSAGAATFDGQWSVRIASPKQECGDGAPHSIGITNGRVASNNAAMQASGRVADGGTISVSLMSGLRHAIGYGHLSGSSGSGTWHGMACSGTWTAEKI